MRVRLALLLMAAVVAGCSSGSGHDRSVLMEGISPGTFGHIHRTGPQEAVSGARSARRYWREYLTKEARLASRKRFPSPSLSVLSQRLEREADAHSFDIVSVRMLHPRRAAPEIVVRTTHYLALARATSDILRGLEGRDSWDYEGFYFEARDERNVPFLAAYNVVRGQIMGGQWARSEALYPFPHG